MRSEAGRRKICLGNLGRDVVDDDDDDGDGDGDDDDSGGGGDDDG